MSSWLLLALLAGSLVYCILVIVAARRYTSVRPSPLHEPYPLSVLKPLAGMDLGLEENLRSFFTQDYPSYEILFAVRTEDDAAVPVVRKLQAEFPDISSRLLFTGEPSYPNAKVFSLDAMMRAAAYDVLVMSDSDIRVGSDMLRTVAAEFQQDPRLGVATCPYRAAGGPSVWSALEAAGMNTEFLSGILVARMLEGMKFAVGPTIVARKQCLTEIGGFERLKDYLAEDFVMGQFAAEAGWNVILSSYVIEHRIGSEPMAKNFGHRLRWNRSTRRSRPAGYVGQLFTNPFPLALLLVGLSPQFWPMLVVTILLRMWITQETAVRILRAPARHAMTFAQDVLSFGFWLAGFIGNTIHWRGRDYFLRKDGTFVLRKA